MNRKLKSFDDLTQQNIEVIAKLEDALLNQRTASDKFIDGIAGFCGTKAFVWVHFAWFSMWILANSFVGIKHFDLFPFPLLALIVSLEAIFLTAFILISQKYQAQIAVRRNHLDLQINLLSEQENTKMLMMLSAIMHHMNIPLSDEEADIMQETVRPEKLAEQIIDSFERRPDSSTVESDDPQ